MGQPKGGKNRKWSKEEKTRIAKRYFDERSQQQLAAIEGLSKGMFKPVCKR